MQAIDHASVNTLRFLAADQVEKAKSGHPGFPLGTAPLMYTLWDRFMRYNPKDPNWFNRDRFVLSPGHGSALLYAMLHLAGYDVSMEELKKLPSMGQQKLRGILNMVIQQVLMRLQARWDMVLQWASVLLLPRLCWQQNIISLNLLLSITIPMDSLPTAT